MVYDTSTNTITSDPNNPTQLFIDISIHGIQMLGELSRMPQASDSLKQDAKTIYAWLGQDIGPLTPASCEKLKTGILGYASNWPAATPSLQRCIEPLQLKKGSYPRPPNNVRDAFDRWFSGANEKLAGLIAEKRKYDDSAEQIASMRNLMRKHNVDFPCSDLPNESASERLIARLHQLSDFTKFFLVVTAGWMLWVWIRTTASFELVGHYFKRWDSDMVFPNLIVVPVLLLIGRQAHKVFLEKFRKGL